MAQAIARCRKILARSPAFHHRLAKAAGNGLRGSNLALTFKVLRVKKPGPLLHSAFVKYSPQIAFDMTIDRLLAAIAAFSVAAILLFGGWLMTSDQNALLSDARQREIDETAVIFSTAMDQAAVLSATHAETLAADGNIRTLLAAGSRDALQAYAKPVFDRLSRLAGVDVVHFHDAKMKSVLRVWDPQNFGQDLSGFRPMIVAANHDRKTQRGLELGIRGLSLRAVAPILSEDGKELIGTVEVGVNLQTLADLAKAASGSDFALVLDKRFLKDQAGAASQADGLVLDANTDKTLFAPIVAGGDVRLSRDRFTFSRNVDGRSLTVQNQPLIDYSGNVIGVILTAGDFSRLEAHYNRTVVTLASLFLGGLVLIYAVLMVAIRSAVVRPLRDLAEKVEATPRALADMAPTSALADFRRLHAAVGRIVSGQKTGE